MIFLGNLPNLNPDKTQIGPEDAFKVTNGQTFGSTDAPLYAQMTAVTLNDANGDGQITLDDETISHSRGGTAQTFTVNAAFDVYQSKIRVMHPDGWIQEITSTLRVMQDSEGNVFLMPPPNDAADYELQEMLSLPIVSVTFSTSEAHYGTCATSIPTHDHCFPCFVRGTMIETEFGSLPVEQLTEGMRVWTRDNGLQPIRWIGSRVLAKAALGQKLKPIRIQAGALGANCPAQDLLVSPQHRILVRSRIAQKIFGTTEVLVAAKQLLQISGIDIVDDATEVEYFHFLFDQHEIVLSNGAETESLYTGPEALKSLGVAAREEIFTLFPELRDRDPAALPEGARILASGRMARKLAVRHAQNRQDLVQ